MVSPDKEKRNLQHKSWYQRNLEKGRIIGREFYRKHRLHIRKIRTLRRHRIRLEVLGHYSSGQFVCACCGSSQVPFLTIDHINGRKKGDGLSGYQLYAVLRQKGFPSGYQVLCYNCNQAKEVYGVCPHQWIERKY